MGSNRRGPAMAFAMAGVLALLVTGCGANATNPPGAPTSAASGNQVRTESRPVSNFSMVTFAGVGHITIQQTGQEKLTITAPQSLLSQVTTSVSGNRLTIGFQGTPPSTQTTISYALQVKQLTEVDISGTGTVSAGSLTGDTLTVNVAGSGSVQATGHAQEQHITLSGTGNFDGSNFASNTASVVINGAGTAIVNVASELDAQITGAGSIQYIGSPTVKQTISGVGTITKR